MTLFKAPVIFLFAAFVTALPQPSSIPPITSDPLLFALDCSNTDFGGAQSLVCSAKPFNYTCSTTGLLQSENQCPFDCTCSSLSSLDPLAGIIPGLTATLPTAVPTSLPTSLIQTSIPTNLLTELPTSLPTGIPTGLPTNPLSLLTPGLPTGLPTTLPINPLSLLPPGLLSLLPMGSLPTFLPAPLEQ